MSNDSITPEDFSYTARDVILNMTLIESLGFGERGVVIELGSKLIVILRHILSGVLVYAIHARCAHLSSTFSGYLTHAI